jgi:hypothetical protein
MELNPEAGAGHDHTSEERTGIVTGSVLAWTGNLSFGGFHQLPSTQTVPTTLYPRSTRLSDRFLNQFYPKGISASRVSKSLLPEALGKCANSGRLNLPALSHFREEIMGHRAYLLVLEDLPSTLPVTGVYFYTHWGGKLLPLLVREALSKRIGWDSPPFLAGLFFKTMTAGKAESDLGFGIAAGPFETEFNVMVVDPFTKRVLICDDDTMMEKGVEAAAIGSWSFEEFIDSDNGLILEAWNTRRPDYSGVAERVEKLALNIGRPAIDEKDLEAKTLLIAAAYGIIRQTVGLEAAKISPSIQTWLDKERGHFELVPIERKTASPIG